MSSKVIAETLNVELTEDESPVSAEEAVSADVEIVDTSESDIDTIKEMFGEEKPIGHVEQDYEFTRTKMKSIITKGEEALTDLMDMIGDDPSARGYEVVSTMLKTLSDMSVQFFDLQKRNRELHQGSLAGVGGKPSGVQVQNGIVFSGDSASVLQHIKNRKKGIEE